MKDNGELNDKELESVTGGKARGSGSAPQPAADLGTAVAAITGGGTKKCGPTGCSV